MFAAGCSWSRLWLKTWREPLKPSGVTLKVNKQKSKDWIWDSSPNHRSFFWEKSGTKMKVAIVHRLFWDSNDMISHERIKSHGPWLRLDVQNPGSLLCDYRKHLSTVAISFGKKSQATAPKKNGCKKWKPMKPGRSQKWLSMFPIMDLSPWHL